MIHIIKLLVHTLYLYNIHAEFVAVRARKSEDVHLKSHDALMRRFENTMYYDLLRLQVR